MKAVGLDAVEIDRIRDMLGGRRDRFLARVFTPAEREQSTEGEGELTYFAGRFAAKEAAMKALGTGWAQGIGFADIEILRRDDGAPEMRLHGNALAGARGENVHGSVALDRVFLHDLVALLFEAMGSTMYPEAMLQALARPRPRIEADGRAE